MIQASMFRGSLPAQPPSRQYGTQGQRATAAAVEGENQRRDCGRAQGRHPIWLPTASYHSPTGNISTGNGRAFSRPSRSDSPTDRTVAGECPRQAWQTAQWEHQRQSEPLPGSGSRDSIWWRQPSGFTMSPPSCKLDQDQAEAVAALQEATASLDVNPQEQIQAALAGMGPVWEAEVFRLASSPSPSQANCLGPRFRCFPSMAPRTPEEPTGGLGGWGPGRGVGEEGVNATGDLLISVAAITQPLEGTLNGALTESQRAKQEPQTDKTHTTLYENRLTLNPKPYNA